MGWKCKQIQQAWYWLFLLLALSWPASVNAHGSGTPRLVNVIAGPYRLWVWSLPDPIRVGETHISVAVEEAAPAEQSTSASDFTVQLTLNTLDQSHPPFTLTTSKQDRFLQSYYETDFAMPAVGEWQATVTISGPAGVGMVAFSFTVLPPLRVNWELVIGGAGLFVALLWGIWRQRSPAKAAHSKPPSR